MTGTRSIHTSATRTSRPRRFFALLAAHGITRLADVRAFPGSRRHPHFAREALAERVPRARHRYVWMPALGGRRRATRVDSPHLAWQVPAFRAYADHADTPEFAAALATLEDFARGAPAAFFCAEALWWQCHRRLIADRLLVAGWQVLHILPGRAPEPHHLPDFARIVDGRLRYDGGVTPALL